MTLKPNSCPHCGGTSGVEGTLTETHVMVATWGGSPEAGGHTGRSSYGLFRCTDCGVRVTLKTVLGQAKSYSVAVENLKRAVPIEAEANECGSCRGYGHFSAYGKPSANKNDRKCTDCRGTGER